MSGNTPTGVLNFLRSKISPSPSPAPGMSGDDQAPDQLKLWLVTYVVSDAPAQYGLFAAVFDSVESRAISQAKFSIFVQGRGRYLNTNQIAECSDSVILVGRPPDVVACIVTVQQLPAGTTIDETWIPYLATTYQWLYISPTTGTMYATQNFQSASAAIARLPYVFAPMSPSAQFYWQAYETAPTYYSYREGDRRLATFKLDRSNDCTLSYSSADQCYEQAVGP